MDRRVETFALRILLTLTMACLSCIDREAQSTNSPSTETQREPKPAMNNFSVTGTPTVDADILVELESTDGQCAGNCYMYKISVFSDGRVRYDGLKNVRKIGVANDRLTHGELNTLRDQLEKANVFEMRDAYVDKTQCKEYWSDARTMHITIYDGTRSKNIFHYQGCEGNGEPEKLRGLENRIEEIAIRKRWIE